MKKENIKLLALFLFIGGINCVMGTAFSQNHLSGKVNKIADRNNDVAQINIPVIAQSNLTLASLSKIETKPVRKAASRNDLDIALFPLRMWLNIKSFKNKFQVPIVGNDDSEIELVTLPKYIKTTPGRKIYLDTPSPKGEGIVSYLKIWLIFKDNKCELAVRGMGNKLPEPLVEIVQDIRIGKCKYAKGQIFIQNIGKIISIEKEDDKKIIVKIKNDQVNQQIFNSIKTMNGNVILLSASSSKLKKFKIKIPENQDDSIVLQGQIPKPVNYADEINKLNDQIASIPDKIAGTRRVEEELKHKFNAIRDEYEKLKRVRIQNSYEQKKWYQVRKEYELLKKQYNEAKNSLPDKLKEINKHKQQLETRKKRLEKKQEESRKQSEAAKNNITNIGRITLFYNKMKLREYEQ